LAESPVVREKVWTKKMSARQDFDCETNEAEEARKAGPKEERKIVRPATKVK
jgi:hypothetical protein